MSGRPLSGLPQRADSESTFLAGVRHSPVLTDPGRATTGRYDPDVSPAPQLPSVDDVMNMLRGVIDPELGADIVELGMARGATVGDDGLVTLQVSLTTAGCPLRAQIASDAKTRVGSLPGVERVTIDWGVLSAEEKAETMSRARWNARADDDATAIPATTKVLGVASGKGGVGKSSVTANLAVALADLGHVVGVIDADIWGFSLPRMLGITGRLEARSEGERKVIVPHTRSVGAGRLEVVSMGFLVEDEASALMWRGLMLNRAVQHFLDDVAWPSDLDYVVIDLPPGTGDVAMGLATMLPRTELLVVTTPAGGAQKVAERAVTMARKSFLRVIGVIENMSVYVAPDGSEHHIFGTGGGQALAESADVELVARIPIEPAVSTGGDEGAPVALESGPAADAFRQLAADVVDRLAPPVEIESCSARLLSAATAALDDAGITPIA